MQPNFLVLEVQKITNFLELTFFLDLAGCALPSTTLCTRLGLITSQNMVKRKG